MLDFKTFLQGMNVLKFTYINWSFDLNNELALKIWYKKFSNLEDKTYMKLIEAYTDKKNYAPQSPAEVLNVIERDLPVNDAWELILSIIKRSFNNSNFLSNVHKEAPNLLRFCENWNIENVEEDTYGNKCYGYSLGKYFKREYQSYLNSKGLVLIGNNAIKLIEA